MTLASLNDVRFNSLIHGQRLRALCGPANTFADPADRANILSQPFLVSTASSGGNSEIGIESDGGLFLCPD
jgi:hypothetical protein